MPKPCGHAETVQGCSLCRVYETDNRYRALWGGEPLPGEPGLVRKAANFVNAAIAHVMAGSPVATPEEKGRRLCLCETCPSYWDAAGRRCLHPSCGCAMDVKAGWKEQKCPIGRW